MNCSALNRFRARKPGAQSVPAILALAVILLATTGNCASFASATPESKLPTAAATGQATGPADAEAPVPAAKRPARQTSIEPGQLAAVALRFTAWGNHERYVADLRERFQLRGYRLRDQAPDTLELVLEESGSTPGAFKFLNFVATIASGTFIPFYNQVNYRLAFRHFRAGELQSVCRYELRNNEFFGALLIPFAPFRWPTSVLNETLMQTVDAYAYGCLPLENSNR